MEQPQTSRRRFLSYLTNLLWAAIGLFLLVPAVRYVLSPLWRKAGELTFVDAGPLADIPADGWRLLTLELVQEDGWRKTRTRHAVWVRRQGDDAKDIAVLSPICPHLGCPVNWDPARSQFVCPCHGGLFDDTGKQVAGPPPRALDPLEFKVQTGRLLVRWADFKIGVPDRLPVNV
jgi:menaquinol-cytochrome c reductase iron-sulfur subunit